MWNYAPLASGLRRASLHLSLLEKLHRVCVNKADCPHVFPYRCSLQASISHVYPEAAKSWGFFYFCSLAPGQHSELTVKEQLPVFSPPSSLSFCAPLHLQFPSHSHQLIHRLSTARPWSQLLNLWVERHFGDRASTDFRFKPRIKTKSILIPYM